jgi:type IX secretion system PorP/SprF family membrane protein
LAQDISFSQVYSSPLYLSPSFAGFTNGGRVALNYRDQWPEIANTFRTYALSYDQYLSDFNSGIGLLMVRDDQGGGQLVTQDIGLVYAYELEITHDIFVRPGLQFKYSERKIDPSLLTQVGPDGDTYSWINSEFAVENYRKIDATASLMVYSDFLWLGFTVDHLVKNDIGFTDIETTVPVKTVIYGGWKYIYQESSRSKNEQSATLAFMYRNQSGFNQLDAGIYWNTNPIEVGLWYRGLPGVSSESLTNNDALIFSLGINLGIIHFAYSYDLTLSELAAYSGGANEFSLIYRFVGRSGKLKSPGPIPCSDPSSGFGGLNYRPKHRKLF